MSIGTRTCGECSQCCTSLEVEALGLARDEPCPDLLACGGCSIYQERPNVCRSFQCLWLRDPGFLPDNYRPDKKGVIVWMGETHTGITWFAHECWAGALSVCAGDIVRNLLRPGASVVLSYMGDIKRLIVRNTKGL